jgi:succinyl-diaminopimelate desuccinylase
MIDSVLSLSKRLIRIQSDPDNAPELQQCLNIVCAELSNFTVEEFNCDGVRSILAYVGKTRPAKFGLILNGHLDVIPAKKKQYKPVIKGGKLYGAGALDMKSNLSCLIEVFKKTAHSVSYPIGLQIVTDEEIGGFKGTKYQIQQGVRSDFIIAGETTNFQIATKAKGVIWAKLIATGRAAHGAYPWRGDNAIVRMNQCLQTIVEKFPVPATDAWVSTINISQISTSNKAHNKVPDHCETTLDIRYTPADQDRIIHDIKALLPKQMTLHVEANEPCLNTPDTDAHVKQLQSIAKKHTQSSIVTYGAQGTSDARHYTEVGGHGIEFGPIGTGIGSDDECIDIESLKTYCTILVEFVLSFSQPAPTNK